MSTVIIYARDDSVGKVTATALSAVAADMSHGKSVYARDDSAGKIKETRK